MKIETTTAKSWNQITNAITEAGFEFKMSHGGKYKVCGVVTITTDAPDSVLYGVSYNPRAVTFR